jgi:hypothetical protein
VAGYLDETTAASISGNMCEVLIGNSNPSEADRQRIEGYLAWKWGTVANLDASHPYKLSPPRK